MGVRGGVVAKALRYKPEGRGFDSRWCQDFSPWHNPAGHTMVDSTSNRNEYQVCFLSSGMSLGVKTASAYGWQPTTITVPLSRNLGALTLLDPSGPAWLVTGVLYFYLYIISYRTKYVFRGVAKAHQIYTLHIFNLTPVIICYVKSTDMLYKSQTDRQNCHMMAN